MEVLQDSSSHDAAALLEERLRIKYTTQLLHGSPVFPLDKSTQFISDLADFLLVPPGWHNITFESLLRQVWRYETSRRRKSCKLRDRVARQLANNKASCTNGRRKGLCPWYVSPLIEKEMDIA